MLETMEVPYGKSAIDKFSKVVASGDQLLKDRNQLESTEFQPVSQP